MSHRPESSSSTQKIILGLLLALTLLGWPLPLQAQGQPLVLILPAPTHRQPEAVARLQAAVEARGGQVVHTFPGQALIARVPQDIRPQLSLLPGVAALFDRPLEPAALAAYRPELQHLAGLWNTLLQPPTPSASTLPLGEPPHDPHDAFIAPDLPAGRSLDPEQPITPGYYQTSEFMAGSVAVGLILLESNGQIDPSTENWTEAEKQLVLNKIVTALHWWAELEPRANLSFVYDDHLSHPLPTGVEPIARPYLGQQYWISDAMVALGYHASSYFTGVRDYNNALRAAYGTDWAFTLFVVDSSNDPDHRFTDGYFAYAYLGGPFAVLTYGNNGYGPQNMDAVAAHEIGHIFHALDQYYNAYQPCTRRSGYLHIENQNSLYGACTSNVTSIMRGQTFSYSARAIDPYAAGQLGWRDSDGDNILDPLDTPLPVSLAQLRQEGSQITAQGQAEIIPYPSPHDVSITINTLAGVQYRLNGGPWQPAAAVDGHFDSLDEAYRFSATLPAPGLYTLEVIALDSAGNRSANPARTSLTLLDPQDGGLNTELYPLDAALASTAAPTLQGVAYHLQDIKIVQVEYRLDGAAWQPAGPEDGAFDSSYEPFVLTFPPGLLKPGPHQIEARATDAAGNVETNWAVQTIEIREQSKTWLPLLISQGSRIK